MFVDFKVLKCGKCLIILRKTFEKKIISRAPVVLKFHKFHLLPELVLEY